MNEYPKLITDCDPKYIKLFEALYWHERERLKLPRDMFIPNCPLCPIGEDTMKE